MNRTKKVIFNTISSGLLQFVTIIASFITPRVLMSVYGSEINGLITSIQQFISYFTLVEAGLAGTAVYALYKPLANKDFKLVSGIVSAAKLFYNKAGYIFLSLTLGMAFIYPTFVKTATLSSFNVAILVLTLGMSGVLEFFTLAKYRVLLTADQKTYIISLASVLNVLISTIIIVSLAHFEVNIVVVRIVALLSIFIRSIILSLYTRKKYKDVNYNYTPDNSSLKKRWDVLYWQITTNIQTGSTAVLATLFTNLETVSVYTVFHLILGGIKAILNIFVNGLYTSFGDVIARKEEKTLQKAYKEFELVYYNLITVIFSVSMVTIMPFIRIYTDGITDVNYNQPILGFLFVLDGLFYTIKVPQGMLIQSAGLYTETKKQVTLQGIIAVVFGIVFAPSYGLAGIMLGMILSNIYRWIDLLLYIPKNVLKLTVTNTLFRQIRVFITVILSCIPFYVINDIPFNDLKSYKQWIIYSLISGSFSVFLVICFDLIYERDELKNLLNRLKGLIKKI